MAGEAERVDAYLDTIKRIEPEIAMIDTGAALASIAISLRRIADALNSTNEYGEVGSAAFANTVKRALSGL